MSVSSRSSNSDFKVMAISGANSIFGLLNGNTLSAKRGAESYEGKGRIIGGLTKG